MMKSCLLIALTFLLPAIPLLADATSCGDDGTTCGDAERCCEHVVAMFSEDHPTSPSYVQGQCVPKEQKCADFWCGNRHCSAGFFGSPTVCCLNTPEPVGTPEYACAYSEVSCPGNSQQLSIRETQPSRTLRRG